MYFYCSCSNGKLHKYTKNADVDQQDTTVVENIHSSGIVIDYVGIYEGTLPCADCEGIKTKLTIKNDTTYELKGMYLGKEDGKIETNGIYNIINGEILELVTPSSGDKTYYKILEDAVALSDASGKLVEGELAEDSILKKK